MEDEEYLIKKVSKKLWLTSWLIPVSFFYAIYQKKYALSVIPLTIFLTSLNYWKDGNNLQARRLDIAALILAFIIQGNYATQVNTAFKYHFTIALGLFFWVMGNVLFKKETFLVSVTCHQLVHFLGTLANLFLYSGK